MVVIEPEPSEEEKTRVAPNPNPKTSSAAAPSDGGEASDGFETASDTDFNGGDDEEEEEIHQQASQSSSSPIHGSLEVSPCEDESRQQKALEEANEAKLDGNKLFGAGQYEEALSKYGSALQLAPDIPSSVDLRSICHANRAICFLKLSKYEDAIQECTKALELNPNYVKALLRRAEAHEKLEHYEEAIADMKKILELDASDVHARRTIHRLEPLAAEKREKMKEEMIGKLKEMGNSVLGRFGMNVDNFKAVKDPNTGSYSISFQR